LSIAFPCAKISDDELHGNEVQMIELSINGQLISATQDQTILEAARDSGIIIPTLCYHKDLSPYGGCQLCLIEVEGEKRLVQACTYHVQDGLIIRTETDPVVKGRRSLLKLILSNYYESGFSGLDDHPNELIHWAEFYGIDARQFMARQPSFPVDADPNPFIWVDFNKCILCTRCVRACAEVQGRFVWGIRNRGIDSIPVAGLDQTLLEARCESCGACVAYCPTGALGNKLSVNTGVAEKTVTTTCAYCGVGCQVYLNVKGNRIVTVSSSLEAPVNGQRLCVKGRYGFDFVNHPDRLTDPLVRSYLLENKTCIPGEERGEWVKTDWETALNITAVKLNSYRNQFGADSIGILSSAKCTNEENYLMNKFARQVIGTNNIDHCARLCHSSTVAGLTASFGSGAMTNPMADIASNARLVFVTGSNTTEQHPVFGTMIRQSVLRRGTILIVADPRKIDLTEFATLHLQLKPGTDVVLFNGLMNIILQNGWEDKEFIALRTEGFEEFVQNVRSFTPDLVSNVTGITVEKLTLAARYLGTVKPGALIWAMGITQHISGVQNVQTLANLQMLLGNIGVSGGGVNPLRGQNNVQGAGDVGALPNVYPAYQPVVQESARKKFENAWGVDLNPRMGMTVTEMIPAIELDRIKALYIMGEDPILSDPDANHVRECLKHLDFMVLQDIFPTETSQFADVLLPGVSFAEKSGTVTNTERRVQLVNPAISPVGNSRQDWEIIASLANRIIAFNDRVPASSAPFAGWEYSEPARIMDEIAALSPIYAGISYQRLRNGENLQWPVTSTESTGTPILHIKEFPRGKGVFTVTNYQTPAELPNEDYPYLLNTGRVLYHWHGGEISRRSRGLMAVYPLPLVEVNPEDAARLEILKDRERVRVKSKRGEIVAFAWITDRVPAGTVYANFHFPESQTNALTIAALDPVSKIPEYKICAVKLEKIN
jgi:formate dehydrogenase major subunit